MGILRACIAALAVALTLPAAPAAQDGNVLERFQLFTECQPLYPLVEVLTPAATDIGLTLEGLQAAMDSRLRAARLYADPWMAMATLYLNVHVVRSAFTVTLELQKPLWDELSGSRFSAPTWSSVVLGTHGRDSGYVLSAVAARMDEFLAAYLRVNYAACQ